MSLWPLLFELCHDVLYNKVYLSQVQTNVKAV